MRSLTGGLPFDTHGLSILRAGFPRFLPKWSVFSDFPLVTKAAAGNGSRFCRVWALQVPTKSAALQLSGSVIVQGCDRKSERVHNDPKLG